MLRSAFLAVFAWALVSCFLWFSAQSIPAISSMLSLLWATPMNVISNVGVGFLIGAFALFLLEKNERLLNFTQLWILVIFAVVGLFFYHWFPFRIYRILGFTFSQYSVIGLVLGIFLCGRKHWR